MRIRKYLNKWWMPWQKSKNANCGLLTKRQLYFGILDQTMHTVKDENGIDTAKLCLELQPKIMGVDGMEGTNFVALFWSFSGWL